MARLIETTYRICNDSFHYNNEITIMKQLRVVPSLAKV
jgi:hypothetical protein